MACAVDQAGGLYVANVLNERIVRVKPAYMVRVLLGLLSVVPNEIQPANKTAEIQQAESR